MRLIGAHRLYWNPDSREFGWVSAPIWHKGHSKMRATVKLAELTCTTVPVQMNTECGLVPSSGTACISNIGLIDNPYVTGGQYLKLVQHEKNYTPYLLEMQAAIWAMENFDTHLHGRHFTLFTDHQPLEKLGKVHTKTLNQLQEAMLTFDFEIVYK